MSSRVSRGGGGRAGRNTQRRKMVLDVDLNAPPCDDGNEVGTSSHVPVQEVPAGHQVTRPQPVPIDVDAIDDDVVVLSSPTAYTEAKNSARINRVRSTVVDVELVELASRHANNRNKRQRVSTNQPIVNCESYVNLELNSCNVGKPPSPKPPPPPPPPPEPTFSCPVCMGPLVEEMSTKCGHIFCKACIKQAIAAQAKCPTCRKKVTMKDTIRIYLPATS